MKGNPSEGSDVSGDCPSHSSVGDQMAGSKLRWLHFCIHFSLLSVIVLDVISHILVSGFCIFKLCFHLTRSGLAIDHRLWWHRVGRRKRV